MGRVLAGRSGKRRENTEIAGAHKLRLANGEPAPESFLSKARARPILASSGAMEVGAP